MNSKIKTIFQQLPKAIFSPRKSIILFWRRVFPFGIIPKDAEAYRIGSWSYGNLSREEITKIFPGIEKTDVRIINAYQRDLGTSMDFSEVAALCSICKLTLAKNIFEIGTYDGNTSLNLAANSEDDAKIITVDLPPDWDGKYALNVSSLDVNVTDRNKVGIQFYEHKEFSTKIRQVFCDSATLDWSEFNILFDLVFIDGNHHYKYVKKDTENALRFLKPGGIIAWHDYGMIEDVSKVVDETAKKIKVKIIRGTRLAVGVKN